MISEIITETDCIYLDYKSDIFEYEAQIELLDQMEWRAQTALRVLYCNQYFNRLKKALDEKDITVDATNTLLAMRLFDCILRGSAPERISGNYSLS